MVTFVDCITTGDDETLVADYTELPTLVDVPQPKTATLAADWVTKTELAALVDCVTIGDKGILTVDWLT